MEVIKLAWYQEQFSYRGKHLVLPPDDVPDRGTMVNDLTLIPKPLRHVDIYQPVTSPETIEYVPKAGHKAVYWLQNADSQKQKWDRYAEIREACGTPVGPGEDRCLVLNLHVAKTREAALAKGRPGQDEFNKFLSPYGRFSSYRNPDGQQGRVQPLPDRRGEQRAEDPDRRLDRRRRRRDRATGATCSTCKHICFFLDYPGLTREEMNEQMHLVAEEVFPRLGEPIERRPITGTPARVEPALAHRAFAGRRRLSPAAGVRRTARPSRQGVPRRARRRTRRAICMGAILAMDVAAAPITLDDTIERAERAARLLAANGMHRRSAPTST